MRLQSADHERHTHEEESDRQDREENNLCRRDEFCVDDGIAVNRLRREAVQGAARLLAVDRVKTQHDADERPEEPEERREAVD